MSGIGEPTGGNIEDATASVGVVDGRVSMAAEGEADVYLKTPDHQPLSVGERHATVEIQGEDFTASVAVDGEELDALVDAVYHAQAELREGDDG